MTEESVLDLDEGMPEYFRDMADVLADRGDHLVPPTRDSRFWTLPR
ncbi:hypothetical protein [Streptomyces sp. NPDC102490]